MNHRIRDEFDQIHAEDELKKKTIDYLACEIKRRKSWGWKVRRLAVCAVFAVCLLCGGLSYKIHFTPAAYIDIDVNPSVGLAVNRAGQVIRCQAYNDDGEAILGKVKLYGTGYGEAFEKLMAAMVSDGYLGADSLLSVTVQSNESGQEARLLNDLQEMAAAEKERLNNAIEADVYAVTEEVKHCADAHHISPAKYLVIQQLIEIDPGVDFEECKGHSVHELQQLVDERWVGHEENLTSHGHGTAEHEHE